MILNGENRAITAYYPANRFPSVSVTGTRCDLMCEHCRAHHLKSMVPVSDGKELMDLARSVEENGGEGFLLSGGCDLNGSVPVMRYTQQIAQLSKEMIVNVHAGFITPSEAEELVKAGVSYFSVDIHQDEGEIRSVLHLDHSAEDYSKLIDNIMNAGGKVVPHITIGFGYYDLFQSGKLIASKGLKDVVVLTMVPTEGTIVEESILSEDAIMDAVKILSDMGLNVILGCMRDRSLRALEKKCIEAGIRRIANPSPETLRWAKENGYTIIRKDLCCCVD